MREEGMGGKGMGEVFIEFRGGTAWSLNSRLQSCRRYHFLGQAIPLGYCGWGKLHLPVLCTVVGKVIPDIMGLPSICFFMDRIVCGGIMS